MEVISNLWRDWPWPVRIVLDLFFIVIVIRGVIANEILDTLKKRGIFTNGIITPVLNWLHRKGTLLKHFSEGHTTALIACSDNRCDTL